MSSARYLNRTFSNQASKEGGLKFASVPVIHRNLQTGWNDGLKLCYQPAAPLQFELV
jgi:hypothetical protein